MTTSAHRTLAATGLCLVGLMLSTALLGCEHPAAAVSRRTPASLGDTATAADVTSTRAVPAYRLPVPILMYHMIGTPPAANPNPDLFVRPQEFQAQMDCLAANHYHAVSLQQVWDAWHGWATLPIRPVVLSFDDGYLPDYTVAAPILSAHHWPGVLFLIAGRRPPALYPSVVRALIGDGWEIDSHTMTHVEVEGLSPKELAFQVGDSRTTLRRMYGIPVNFFCYPSGRYDAAAINAVRAAGYLAATTTEHGLAQLSQGQYTLRRIRVSRGESLEGFAAELK